MSNWRADSPYNALPAPPSAELLETRAVLKAAISARSALAQLDEAAASLPNPTVLINSIPLLEAQASSEIENIVTTTDELFRNFDADDSAADPATRETLRYRTALRMGFEAVRERGLTSTAAEKICTRIKGREMTVRSLPGTRIGNPSTHTIAYSPPEGAELIRQKLQEWEAFIHADDGLDPLVRMAAAHYQFEAIHPFADGNGRTGRVLNILMLVDAGLLRLPVLYLSRYIIATKADYYRLLLEVTSEGAWEPWLIYMLEGVRSSASQTLAKIREIRDLQEWYASAAKDATRGGANADFQSVLFEQPYCRIGLVVARCGVTRPTATAWLEALAKAGLLEDRKVGRDRLFVNRKFLDLLRP